MWVLGLEPGFSAIAARTFNDRVIFPAFLHAFVYFRLYCVSPCVCPGTRMTSEDNTDNHVGAEDHTEAVRLRVESLHLLSHLAHPE